MRVWHLPLRDKASAWNHFVHHLWPGADTTFILDGYARVTPGLKPGVLGAAKQLKGSNTPSGLNVNALISQRVADMGGSPVFYSTLAEIEKAPQPAN